MHNSPLTLAIYALAVPIGCLAVDVHERPDSMKFAAFVLLCCLECFLLTKFLLGLVFEDAPPVGGRPTDARPKKPRWKKS